MENFSDARRNLVHTAGELQLELKSKMKLKPQQRSSFLTNPGSPTVAKAGSGATGRSKLYKTKISLFISSV